MSLLALACTGCQLNLDVAIDVDRNGGGTFDVAVAADAELLELAAGAGADPLGDLAKRGEQLGQGWSVADATDDSGLRTVTLSAPFDDPEQFAELTREVSAALDADEVTLLEPFSLVLTDEEVRLAGAAGAEPGRAIREYGLTPKAAVRRINQTEAFDYDVTVTMPGEVASSTATDAAGRELVWEIPVGQRVEIVAASQRPGPPILRAVAGAAGGALIAALLLFAVARRRRRA